MVHTCGVCGFTLAAVGDPSCALRRSFPTASIRPPPPQKRLAREAKELEKLEKAAAKVGGAGWAGVGLSSRLGLG